MPTRAKTFRTRAEAIESARGASVLAWDDRSEPLPSDAEHHYIARVDRKYVHFPTSMSYLEAEATFGENLSIVGVVIAFADYKSFTGK